ncbi:hypothetical protein ACFU96_06210 [Streptomyces sp. NPDC057620]|uniref:hypothetical protein n=1 Tax=Streptomyces sp. NPDC057620 TaxID=3346185 RepID=UPI00367764A0
MSNPDELLVGISALVESGQSNRMSLTVVAGGAVITGRLAPEAVWRERVSEVLKDSDHLGAFSGVFLAERPQDRTGSADPDGSAGPDGSDGHAGRGGAPTHLHFHLARILQGNVGIPETGGMYRVAITDVSAWTVGDFSYSDH